MLFSLIIMRKAPGPGSHGPLGQLGSAVRLGLLFLLIGGSVLGARLVKNDSFSADMGHLALLAGVTVVTVIARDLGVLPSVAEILRIWRGGPKQ